MGKTLKVLLKNNINKEFTVKYRTAIFKLLDYIEDNDKYIAARVNNEITSLSYRIKINCTIEFISNEEFHGMEVYRRSLSFLLEKVVVKLFPDRRLVIGHSLGPGYYFDLEGNELKEDEVKLIENEMFKEVLFNKEIVRENISYIEVLEHFNKNNREDKYMLLSTLNMPKLSIYRCDNFFQVVNMPLVKNTGKLNLFKLIYYPPGFILQFPKKSNPLKVAKFTEHRKIFEIYQENKKQGKTLDVDNVGKLNRIILNKQINSFIQVEEALHEKKIISLATEVYNRKDNIHLVCIAGPSSAGKTTFSKRFAIQLKALGLNPVTISVDNYFVDRQNTPLDENGDLDYESIYAINLDLFNNHLQKLLNGEEIDIPYYNFQTGMSQKTGKTLKLKKNEIIITEGIHCLNEKLTHVIPKDKKFKIYVSALTQMNIDDNNRIPTSDNRLIRRLVRDYKYRGHDALTTLKMWVNVRKGEEKYIFPFQNNTDGYFNSTLDFELSLLKPYAEPILMEVKPYHKEYSMATRLLKTLSYFLPVRDDIVPSTSIIREFIGGSSFHY